MHKILYGIAGVSILMGGCTSHLHEMKTESFGDFLKGRFIHEGTTQLVLESATHTYVAENFEVRRHRDLADLHKRYRMSEPKHWDRISSGLDRDHESFSSEPKPRAASGEELTCRLAWRHASDPQGICVDSTGKEYAITFK